MLPFLFCFKMLFSLATEKHGHASSAKAETLYHKFRSSDVKLSKTIALRYGMWYSHVARGTKVPQARFAEK